MAVSYVVKPASGSSTAAVFSDSSLKTKIGTKSKGETVEVLSSSGSYYKIKYSGGSSSSSSGTVKANSGLNARKGPGTSYAKVGAFNNGAKLTIHESSGGWHKVTGTSGWGTLSNVWVSGQYVITSANSANEGYMAASDVSKSSNEPAATSTSTSSYTLNATQVAQDRNFNSSYRGVASKRYVATEEEYKRKYSEIGWALGLPPKYNMDIDIQYVSDIGFGRAMSETYFSNPTLLSICPGKVKMFPHLFNQQKRDNAFEALKSAANNDKSVLDKMISDNNGDIFGGQIYDFQQDTEDFGKRLNLLCRSCAILLGIGEEYVPNTSTKFKNFDYTYWGLRKLYTPGNGVGKNNVFTSFWRGGISSGIDGLIDKNYIHFFMSTDDSSYNDQVDTQTESSFIDSMVSTVNTVSSQLGFFSGIGFNNQMDAEDTIRNALNGVIGENAFTKLVNNALSGGKLRVPKIVGDTNFQQSISCSLRFVSPYGSPKSIFLWCIVPICHIMALALPKQLSESMYSYPYLLKVYCQGWFNTNLAVITSMEIQRGGNDNTLWTTTGLATDWVVKFNIAPLYEQLVLPSTDHPLLFIRNDGLIDYLGNLCGFDLKSTNLDVKTNLLTSFIKNRFTGIPSDIQRWFNDKISTSLSNIFEM